MKLKLISWLAKKLRKSNDEAQNFVIDIGIAISVIMYISLFICAIKAH